MAQAYKPLPHASELWELFAYKPLTGELVWRKTRGGRWGVAGSPGNSGSVDIRLNRKLYRAHRLVWCWCTGEDPGAFEVDHKDRVRSNNQAWNLRLATKTQNSWNKPAKGYQQTPGGRYYSRIRVGAGKYVYLGSYDTPEEAGAAYAKAAAELHGEFACTE